MGSVRISGLSKSYGPLTILDDIDLAVRDGEFFTLLGPSGCGKTTLLRIIAGFLQQDRGSVAFDGQQIDTLPPHRRDIGMVFQDYAVFPHLSVLDNIGFGLTARRLSRQEVASRAADAVKLVQLQGLEHRMPASLSGGQQQRVGIARALAIRPRLLLMDEPLSNLDAKLRLQMRHDIREIQRRLGITTIYVTHDQEEALAISDRVCVLQAGRIEQVGTPFEIYRKPMRRFAAGFVGTMNFMPAEVAEDGTLVFAGSRWELDCPAPSGPVEIAIRPENVLFRAEADQKDGTGILLRGTVSRTSFLGREAHCEVETRSGRIIAQLASPDPAMLDGAERETTVMLPFDALLVFRRDGAVLSAGLMRACR